MIRTEWSKQYSVGHERIDHEHQVFLDLIKNVSSADEKGYSKDKISRLIIELEKYADFHFYSEENIMLDLKYPGYEAHVEAHRNLISDLKDKSHNYHTGIIDLEDLVEFLFSWFAFHTTKMDKELAEYIQNSSS